MIPEHQHPLMNDLETVFFNHGVGGDKLLPESIARRVVEWIDEGMPTTELKNDEPDLLTLAYENEESDTQEYVPSFDIGSQITIAGVKFVVTDFQNAFDRPATAGVMSLDDIRKRSQQAATFPRPSRRYGRPYGPPTMPYRPEVVYTDDVEGSDSDRPISPAN